MDQQNAIYLPPRVYSDIFNLFFLFFFWNRPSKYLRHNPIRLAHFAHTKKFFSDQAHDRNYWRPEDRSKKKNEQRTSRYAKASTGCSLKWSALKP